MTEDQQLMWDILTDKHKKKDDMWDAMRYGDRTTYKLPDAAFQMIRNEHAKRQLARKKAIGLA